MKKYILLLMICIAIIGCKENTTQTNQQNNSDFNEFIGTNFSGLWEISPWLDIWQFKLSPKNFLDSITWNKERKYSDTLLLVNKWDNYLNRYEWNEKNALFSVKYFDSDSIYAITYLYPYGPEWIEIKIINSKKWFGTYWKWSIGGDYPTIEPQEITGTLIE